MCIRDRGAGGWAAGAAGATGAGAALWGVSVRANRASSSSMRWSVPRLIFSSALPNRRMARTLSLWGVWPAFSR